MNIFKDAQLPGPFQVSVMSVVFLFKNLKVFGRILAIPVFIELIFYFIKFIKPLASHLSIVFFLASLAFNVFFAVRWFRFLMGVERAPNSIVLFRLGFRELKFLMAGFLVSGLLVVIFLPIFILLGKAVSLQVHESAVLFNIKNTPLFYIACFAFFIGYVFSFRFNFTQPTVALDGPIDLIKSWRQTKGITLRMFLSSLIIFIGTMGVQMGFVWFFSKPGSMILTLLSGQMPPAYMTVSACLGYLSNALLQGVIAIYYRHQNELKIEQELEAV
jgi:hypothetical protein